METVSSSTGLNFLQETPAIKKLTAIAVAVIYAMKCTKELTQVYNTHPRRWIEEETLDNVMTRSQL